MTRVLLHPDAVSGVYSTGVNHPGDDTAVSSDRPAAEIGVYWGTLTASGAGRVRNVAAGERCRWATHRSFTPPFTFGGRLRIHSKPGPLHPTYGLVIHPVHVSNLNNVWFRFATSDDLCVLGVEVDDVEARVRYVPFPVPSFGRWHSWQLEVPEAGVIRFAWNGDVVHEWSDRRLEVFPAGPVGMRLDGFDVELDGTYVDDHQEVPVSTFRVDPKVIHDAAARRDRVYPYAVWAPIPEASRQPDIHVSTFITHSMAGPRLTSLEALRSYLGRDDVEIEATFVGPDFDGRMFQVVHIDQRADCNYLANPFAVSAETQDNGAATLATTPWSPEQVEQLAGVAAFVHLRDGVPLMSPARWDAGGVGYHSQFPEWSKYQGKTCPGAARIAQMPAVLARAAEIAAWRPTRPPVNPPVEEDDDMKNLLLYRDTRYSSVFLIGAGAPIEVSPKVFQHYRGLGVPLLEDTHPRLLASILHATGMTVADLAPAG